MNESQVSDVYVRLGNDFNAAVAAFRSYNIDMRYVRQRHMRYIIAHARYLAVNYYLYLKTFAGSLNNVYLKMQQLLTLTSIYLPCDKS